MVILLGSGGWLAAVSPRHPPQSKWWCLIELKRELWGSNLNFHKDLHYWYQIFLFLSPKNIFFFLLCNQTQLTIVFWTFVKKTGWYSFCWILKLNIFWLLEMENALLQQMVPHQFLDEDGARAEMGCGNYGYFLFSLMFFALNSAKRRRFKLKFWFLPCLGARTIWGDARSELHAVMRFSIADTATMKQRYNLSLFFQNFFIIFNEELIMILWTEFYRSWSTQAAWHSSTWNQKGIVYNFYDLLYCSELWS